MNQRIIQLVSYTKPFYETNDSIHRWDHIERVTGTALKIAFNPHKNKVKQINWDVLLSGIILHDFDKSTADKNNYDHAKHASDQANVILSKFGFSLGEIVSITHCILAHRFRSNGIEPESIEAKILYDADKLDSIGAVGIAKSFYYAGIKNQSIFYGLENETADLIDHGEIDHSKYSPYIEFLAKSKRIIDSLILSRSKEIAHHRIEIMIKFFDNIRKEIFNAPIAPPHGCEVCNKCDQSIVGEVFNTIIGNLCQPCIEKEFKDPSMKGWIIQDEGYHG